MKKQAILRKTLSGSWTEFAFDVPSNSFFVKNFTSAPIYVSFQNNDQTDASAKILPNMGEELCITRSSDNPVGSIYVSGTGEVEVQALDSYVEQGFDIEGTTLVVPESVGIENGTMDLGSVGEIQNHTLIV